MEDHPGVVNTDNSIPSDPGPSGAMASVIRQVIKDNPGDNEVVSENMVSHIYPRII